LAIPGNSGRKGITWAYSVRRFTHYYWRKEELGLLNYWGWYLGLLPLYLDILGYPLVPLKKGGEGESISRV